MSSGGYTSPALSRCLAIASRLQREPATVYELGELLNASKRTIDRDLTALVEMGAPLIELPRVSNAQQRYSLAADWSMRDALYAWLIAHGDATGRTEDRTYAIAAALREGQSVNAVRNRLGVSTASVRAVQATLAKPRRKRAAKAD